MRGLVIGVDLGATDIWAALGSIESGILKRVEERTVQSESPDDVIQQFIRLIRRASANDLGEVRAIGIGSIGLLDCWRGVILNPPNVPFKNAHIVEALRDVFRVPVYLLNDCPAAALGNGSLGLAED